MALLGTRGTWDYPFYGTSFSPFHLRRHLMSIIPVLHPAFSDLFYSVCPSDSVYDCSLQVARSEFSLHCFYLPSHSSSEFHTHSLYLLCIFVASLLEIGLMDFFFVMFASTMDFVYPEEGEWLPKVSQKPIPTHLCFHSLDSLFTWRHDSAVFVHTCLASWLLFLNLFPTSEPEVSEAPLFLDRCELRPCPGYSDLVANVSLTGGLSRFTN